MINNLKNFLRQQAVNEFSSLSKGKSVIDKNKAKEFLSSKLEELCSLHQYEVSELEKKALIDDIINDFVGFSKLTSLMQDPGVTEVMVNGPDKVFAEKNGKMELTSIKFDSEEELMHLVHNMLAPTRRRVDESFPYTDLMLSDNSRVNIVLRPVSLEGPLITVRKFMKNINMIEDLVSYGTMDERMGKFLIAAIKAKLNIIFAGATGAGKTTTLNVLSHYISSSERIITIEDAAELTLSQDHVVRLETRQPNIEGKGEITIRDLFKNSMRMRPNRIILGEVRGAEALDFIQSISSGHTGSLAVIHASSPHDVARRLETMIMMFGLGMSANIVRSQIASCLDLIVQHEQLSDGSRKITHISPVVGYSNDDMIIEDSFFFEQQHIESDGKVVGRFRSTGIKPAKLFDKFKKYNIPQEEYIFEND